MDFTNMLPITYLGDFFQVPLDIMLIVIILTGYLTVRITQKNKALKKEIPAMDTVFLMSMCGLTWFIRIALILFWIYQLIIHQESIRELEGIPLGYVFALIAYALLSTSYDINAMRNKRFFDKKFRSKFAEKHRFDIVLIMSLGFGIFLSFGIFYSVFIYGIELLWLAFFYFFLIIFCISPMISVFIILIKKLHEEPYIPIGRLKKI